MAGMNVDKTPWLLVALLCGLLILRFRPWERTRAWFGPARAAMTRGSRALGWTYWILFWPLTLGLLGWCPICSQRHVYLTQPPLWGVA